MSYTTVRSFSFVSGAFDFLCVERKMRSREFSSRDTLASYTQRKCRSTYIFTSSELCLVIWRISIFQFWHIYFNFKRYLVKSGKQVVIRWHNNHSKQFSFWSVVYSKTCTYLYSRHLEPLIKMGKIFLVTTHSEYYMFYVQIHESTLGTTEEGK